MKILRVNMTNQKVTEEKLPEEWLLVGGRGLIARIMNKEVPPFADPLGPDNKLVIAAGPLAGTLAPQLGRISVGGKSPLTLGIKEANAGGPAAQKLDRLEIRAIVVEGASPNGQVYCLKVSAEGAALVPANELRGINNYRLAKELFARYGKKPALITIGSAGERRYKAAAVALTDIFGDPSRNAARGGMGAVMGAKGLKAIVIDDTGTKPVGVADRARFNETVKSWTDIINKDVTCNQYGKFGTPFAVASNSYQGTMPGDNYTTGRPGGFRQVTGEELRKKVWSQGGKMHGCMPGCIVQCSIIYNDAAGKHTASAYEYEAVSLLGTNLGIADLDAIARLIYICDDLGVDLIEVGSSLALAMSAGKMRSGDVESAVKLLNEIEQDTEMGCALANGAVATGKALDISRVAAFHGQAMPAHDARAVKGVGTTYATSPMGADHTAGLTYRSALAKTGQAANSLRFQVQAATCDTFGYCLNAVPGGNTSIYNFLADMMSARFGLKLSGENILETGKQTLRDELKFNEGTEFSQAHPRVPAFMRTEAVPPTNSVFDVDDAELDSVWKGLDKFSEPKRVWEVRFPTINTIVFGAGVFQRLGEQAARLGIKKAFIIADPIMKKIGNTDKMLAMLARNGIEAYVFTDVEPDPPVEEIEKTGKLYKENGCNGIIAMGGGSSMDAAKATGLRVTHPGLLTEFESMVGGSGKIRQALPPLICIPTTSGTGSEVNPYAVITDKEREVKFVITNERLVPNVAIIDPEICRTMPPALTAETGIDALAHCVEGYMALATPYHPFYEALALYGAKLVGRSLRAATANGNDIEARTDMCMAAVNGGIAFSKGLGIGHAIGHALGAHYHVSHGRAVAIGLLCFARAAQEHFQKKYLARKSPAADMAWALDQTEDLETALRKLYADIGIPSRLRDLGVPEADLEKIMFETSKDVANLTGNPVPVNEQQLLALLKAVY